MKEYLFHRDSDHGWLEVSRDDLRLSGVEARISRYSYISGDGGTVYLEEDCDAAIYLDRVHPGGIGYRVKTYTGSARLANSFVRRLRHWVESPDRQSLGA